MTILMLLLLTAQDPVQGWVQYGDLVIQTHAANFEPTTGHQLLEAELYGGDMGELVYMILNHFDAVGREPVLSYETLLNAGLIYDNHVTTGIDPPPTPPAVRIWPNPFTNGVTVWSSKVGTLRIYDIAGRFVEARPVAWGLGYHALTVPSGVYFWRLGNETGKLIRIQ